ncbi:MAG: SH3 domain-containing protein [Polaromonas sp.]
MILSKFNLHSWAVICGMLLLGGAAGAQDKTANEPVLIKREAQLRDAPGESSRSLAALPVRTSLTRLGERQGPWIKVRMADGTSGWVHMFDITSAGSASQGGAGSSALRGITSFFNKGSAQAANSTVATSTVGIRGLSAEDLAGGQPSMAAVTQVDAIRLDAAQARQFAASASLVSRQVEPLPVPASAAAPGSAAPEQISK